MKYHLPEDYSHFEKEGLKADRLGRKAKIEALQTIINTSESNLVISIDAEWGVGKTSFVKMLEGSMKDKVPFIYFDAYKSDYHHDPISAIAGEIYSLAKDMKLDCDEQVVKFLNYVKAISNGGWKGALSFVSQLIPLWIIKKADIDSEDIQAIASNVGGDLKAAIEESLQSTSQNSFHVQSYLDEKDAMQEVKNSLKKLAEDLMNSEKMSGKPAKNLVFVIDELDRCRPDYALALLESIKHLFSADNVIFILVTNRKELGASLEGVYGSRFNGEQYLEKFIHLNIQLENVSDEKRSYDGSYTIQMMKSFITDVNKKLEINLTDNDINVLTKIAVSEKVPARSLIKIMVNIGFIRLNDKHITADSLITPILFLLCIWSFSKPQKIEYLLELINDRTKLIDTSVFTSCMGHVTHDVNALKRSIRFAFNNFVGPTNSGGDEKLTRESQDDFYKNVLGYRNVDKRQFLLYLITTIRTLNI